MHRGRRWALTGCVLAACGSTPEAPDPIPSPNTVGSPAEAASLDRSTIHGRWRFELESPGGPLPFFVELDAQGGRLVDGHEELPLSELRFEGERLTLRIDHYDSEIEGRVATRDDGRLGFVGTWKRRSPGVDSFTVMKATGARDAGASLPRFDGAQAALTGRWRLTFIESDGSTYAGVAELERAEDGGVSGTILTDTGDYRYLRGGMDGDQLRLSVFDGAHAFLFYARRDKDGKLTGDFWSRDSYHARFVGEPLALGDADGLADPFESVKLTADDGRFRFDFPALGGGRLDDAHERFAGKPLVVEIFGTWCPNCNDQGPLMSRWYAEYQPRGLEMVGIAFEFTGEETSDMEMLQRYADKYEVRYPLLLGGTNDKKLAGERLPDLSKVASYPTTLFIDRQGKVQAIYSGFSGPATGERFERLESQFRAQMDALVAP